VNDRAVTIPGPTQEGATKPSIRTTYRAAVGLLVALSLMIASPAAAQRAGAGASGPVQDMMFDLQIIPLDGPAAKPFALQDLDGRRVALADQKGKVTLLYFWATW
jgi:cytochrome oxidase Cu insertion factor (SCO1/SenC/PrrC family)